jgi:hypothetical protein
MKYDGMRGEMRNAYKILVGKSQGKISLGRLVRRWEDNLKLILRKYVVMIWIRLIWLSTGTGGILL